MSRLTDEVKKIQDIIKRGCASGQSYPWCEKGTDCSKRACWYHEAKEIQELSDREKDEECEEKLSDLTFKLGETAREACEEKVREARREIGEWLLLSNWEEEPTGIMLSQAIDNLRNGEKIDR